MAVEDDLLASLIEHMKKRKRWPPYKKKWATGGSTSSIYAKYPFAWVAFQFALSLSQGRHYPGQGVIRNQCDQLRQKEDEVQRQVAAQWNNLLAQDSDLIKKMKKCLHHEPSGGALEDDDSTADSPAPLSPPSPPTTGTFSQTLHDQAQAPIIFNTQDNDPSDQILVRASLPSARRLLPSDLYDAVHREPHPTIPTKFFAAITMQFSSAFNNNECNMAIRIRADTVAYFASKWFNVRIESKQGLRCIRFPKGPTMVMGASDLVLSGFPRDILASEFDSELSEAIMQSPRYLTDVYEENLGTSTVWMKLSNNANHVAEVVLSLGLLRGTAIRMALYSS